jgi:hypothetical protein
VTRELADVPYWSSQRQEYERQIDERKQQRSMQGGSAMAHAMAPGMAPYGSQNRAPTPPIMPPLGMGPPGMGGGMGVAPGYKVWDPTRIAAPTAQGGAGYRQPGRITGAGVLTSTGALRNLAYKNTENYANVAKPFASLLVTARLSAAHKMSVLMPPTADEFVDVLKGGDHPCFTGANEPGLTCTGSQIELLGGLIDEFNTATSAQARFARVCRFMVDAVAAEQAAGPQTLAGGTPQTVEAYKMVPGAAPETVYFLEDYPDGNEAHVMTLAVGVFRWVRFNASLVDAQVQSFTSVEERNAAVQQLGVV